MKAKSIKGNSPEVIKKALELCIAEGFKPTLAFVFISIKQDIESVCLLLDQQGVKIFGATSGGEFINGDIDTGSIAILLVDMDPSNFMVILEDYRDRDPVALAEAMARKAKEDSTVRADSSLVLSISLCRSLLNKSCSFSSTLNFSEKLARAFSSASRSVPDRPATDSADLA